MSKKPFKEHENECPICEGIIWGKGVKVVIEGAKLTVCQNCAQHGEKITEKIQKSPIKVKISPKSSTTPKVPSNKQEDIIDTLEIVPDYSKRIRDVRMANNLTQEKFALKIHEKESLIKRIEGKQVEPSIDLAKKIERTYNITLLKKVDEIEVDTKKYMKKSTGSTLGDTAFIKKKN